MSPKLIDSNPERIILVLVKSFGCFLWTPFIISFIIPLAFNLFNLFWLSSIAKLSFHKYILFKNDIYRCLL